jgi:hypothetical protein
MMEESEQDGGERTGLRRENRKREERMEDSEEWIRWRIIYL